MLSDLKVCELDWPIKVVLILQLFFKKNHFFPFFLQEISKTKNLALNSMSPSPF